MARPRKQDGTKIKGGALRSKRGAPPLFDLTIPNLETELERLLDQIPAGRVTTYGQLADALGLRAAARWVGEYLRDHEHTSECPCHRVVRKEGELGLYLRGRDPEEKARALRREGIGVREGLVERFPEVVFSEFEADEPLARLIELQHAIAERVRQQPYDAAPPLTAGLDVSYRRDGAAVGACAVVETASGRLVWSTTRRRLPDLPYIPSLLTFRELPLLLTLCQDARREFSDLNLFFVDGNGILHPRGAGIATCFGVVADVPTIGVAKSLLCGKLEADGPAIEGSCPVSVDGSLAGAVLKRSPRAHPLYVSPGQYVDVPSALRMTGRLDFGHRLPEPLFWADRLSRAEARHTSAESPL
jgi:deoxyribonuclease V